MTSVTITAHVFERGDELPSVCAVTGGRPDRLRRVVLTRTPLWVWLLLPVPLLFVLGYVFATERIVGRLPLRDRVHRRRQLLTVGRWVSLAAVFVVLGAVIFTSLSGTFAALCLIPLVAFGLLSGEREKITVKGRILPGDRVELSGVAPRFAAAVDQLQPFLR